MPTPREGYRLADGTRVPGVTSVLSGLGWSKPGLMHWAHAQGLAGLPLYEARDAAADAGTIAHAMIEAHILGTGYLPPAETDAAILANAHRAYQQFTEWEEDSRITVEQTEVRVLSEHYRFGGTIDWIARRRGEQLVLPDVKTSKGIYGEAIIQVAAYVHAYEEQTGIPLDGGAAVVRFSKDGTGFTHRWIQRAALEQPWRAFLALRELYDLKPSVEALAK